MSKQNPGHAATPSGRPDPAPSESLVGAAVWTGLKRAMVGLLLVLLLPAVAWWWAGTEGSLATALQWVTSPPDDQQANSLQARGVTGSLRGGGRVEELSWQNKDTRIKATGLELRWQPQALLSRTIHFTQLSAQRLEVQRTAATDQPPSKPPGSLRIPLPAQLGLRIDALDVAQVLWQGRTPIESGRLRARYAYTGTNHQVELTEFIWAGGRYQGRAKLHADAPFALQADLSGDLKAGAAPALPSGLPLTLQATAQGNLSDLQLQAELGTLGTAPNDTPQATVKARVAPWAALPVPEAQASFRAIDTALFWPSAPHTRLSGTASVQAQAGSVWQLKLDARNASPGPWDKQRLPAEQLQARGEWRDGMLLLRSLQAQLGGGRLQGSGQWQQSAQPQGTAPWQVQLNVEGIQAEALYSRLPAQRLAGRASVASKGAASGQRLDVDVLLRSSEATLQAKGQYESAAQSGGQGELTLRMPGLSLLANGELRPTRGNGQLTLDSPDLDRAQRWLSRLPGLSGVMQAPRLSGQGRLQLAWQGGWRDPQLQARLSVPQLQWSDTAASHTAASASIRLRDMQGLLDGRLSQATLNVQGRAESGARRLNVQLQADAGAVLDTRRATPTLTRWQGLLRQLEVSLQDPALSTGPWRLGLTQPVALRGMPQAATLELDPGQAVLTAPPAVAGSARGAPNQALLTWQATRRQAGEWRTAGTLRGLPLAWADALLGSPLGQAGLSAALLFDGQWEAAVGQNLQVQARLQRSSGDLSMQAETAEGRPTRIAAGLREASLTVRNEGDKLNAQLRWTSERAGNVQADLQTQLTRRTPAGETKPHWLWAADAPVSGQLKGQLPRIGVWSVLAPPGWRLRGAVAADLTLQGTRADPQLQGSLQADDLALRSVVDGIELGRGRLRAQLEGTRIRIDQFSLQGAAPAGRAGSSAGGGGMLRAEGEANWQGGKPQVRLNAKLERLRASVRNDRQITVSGQLEASLSDGLPALSGLLKVDQARILLPDEAQPQLGDDVLVRGAATPVGKPRSTRTPLQLAVQIDLGEDFLIQGRGVDTRMRGILALIGDSLATPRLYGTLLTANGQYRAYGQRLDIEEGVLRFGGPLSNPALEILAIRPNLTQRVGVQISGTALLPRVRLYAEPELPDAEKLSWLVLGRSSASGGAEAALLQQAALSLLGSRGGANTGGLAASLGLDELSIRAPGGSNPEEGTASGGAITLGKRFSQNFYAAYEHSISGAVGTLYLFYELSQRLTVRAQAGEQAAVDLIFTVPYE